jgi:hypothetical protein
MGVVRLASTLWAQLLAGGGGLVGVVRAIISLPATLLAAFAAALNAVLPTRITDTVSSLDAPDETPSHTDADATELPREQLTIRTLWREFTAAINPPNLSAKTPGEVGRYAIDQGVPSRPVRYVVEAFRRVEYAHDDPAQVDTEAVHDAVQSATTAETDTGATEASTEGTDGE